LLPFHSVSFICLKTKHIKIKINKTTILPAVLYGCEAWSFTFREEQRLVVPENRVLRISIPEEEVTRLWRTLHSEELNNLYSLPNIIRMIK
jgi:hypothetical protein